MIKIVKPGRSVGSWYEVRQQDAARTTPHSHPTQGLCNGILDYVYGVWWKCRTCRGWIDQTPVDADTAYCGTPLVGGWCKRAIGHQGDHACA